MPLTLDVYGVDRVGLTYFRLTFQCHGVFLSRLGIIAPTTVFSGFNQKLKMIVRYVLLLPLTLYMLIRTYAHKISCLVSACVDEINGAGLLLRVYLSISKPCWASVQFSDG